MPGVRLKTRMPGASALSTQPSRAVSYRLIPDGAPGHRSSDAKPRQRLRRAERGKSGISGNQVNMKKFGLSFLNVFLLTFMLLIFGPAEIFFANATEFEFVYGEFAGYLAVAAVGAAAVAGGLLTVLPEGLYRLVMSLIFGVSAAGYLQVMLLNRKLDLLGLNPEGYQVETGAAAGNLCVWLLVLAGVIALAYVRKEIWKGLVKYGAAFLLCVQAVALVSLLVTAREDAYHHEAQEWHLTGEEQYVVSARENVILIILDYFSNQDLLEVQAAYPDVMDCLHDFTYYNNTDCNYYGTFPSVTHMLTGKEVDASIPVNDWFYKVWTDPDTVSFYEQLREKDYVVHLYSPDTHHLCGTNDAEIFRTCFSNVTDSPRKVDVFYKLLFKTMTKMSCYRMMPELLKNVFYTEGSEYADIITYEDDIIHHNNADFYRGLLDTGLTADRDSNYFIIQHLLGTHEYTTTADCMQSPGSTLEDTAKGCMVMVEEYLNQLKQVGAYDNSTIIVTSDHGDMVDSQVIFYIKEPGVTREAAAETNAPISLCELRPTIARAAGLDSARFGRTIYDFAENEQRERQVWVRDSDIRYTIVQNYAEDRIGYANIYKVYKYTGDYDDLLLQIEQEQYDVVQMVDSFF